jgi:succinate dehydrogenase/fumarate reductase flavoprotein subunit
MAASFVNNGGIDEKMFLDANGEHVGVFCKLEPFIEEVRETTGMPDYLRQLETLVRKTPNAVERLERMRGLFSRWSKVAQEASAAS